MTARGTAMRKVLLPVVVVVALAFYAYSRSSVPDVSGAPAANATDSDAILANAFDKQISDIQVEGRGTVVRVLPDDNEGGRHQRFILRLNTGQTLLIAHNIDLASRIRSLRAGDTVAFSGEYEWSAKGGVVHWTHRDPNGRHQAGWLRHNGRSFQ